ncbi:hypothetical protein [Leptothoe sp. PORK10 BA2]|uniref:hypothetical protein n=1 Tax=Leptothoe sp. PORK10 BA2 TaxID=3110254 RepID=UPI002B1FB456|nr:hypothetical protein [Leptothoe sp. PORK10 BA2]MEA5464333.1 hypothetical protein [Leptothoe sp. PORK10 BA2]
MLQSLFDLLQQIDTSIFSELNDLDWTNLATYGALAAAFVGIIWTSSKSFLKLLWQKTEGIVGFVVSTLVVISLWYTLLRVHVSISFNLDKEVFDNLLWFSAILFTPYYLVHYNLFKGFVLTVVRSIELLFDLLVFSWFTEKAEQNRQKWRTRINNVYAPWKNNFKELFQKRVTTAQDSQISLSIESVEDETTANADHEANGQDITGVAH